MPAGAGVSAGKSFARWLKGRKKKKKGLKDGKIRLGITDAIKDKRKRKQQLEDVSK